MGRALDPLRVILAQPRGFCAGVERAIAIVDQALAQHGAPVYVRHEIVHNKHVVESLRARGAVFVEEVEAVPAGALTVFSAHGVSRTVEQAAAVRNLDVIDATCPLVLKVHKEGQRYAALDYDVVLIGHAGHAEVEGTRGQIDGRVHVLCSVDEVEALKVRDPARVAYVTQTTLSMGDTRAVIAALMRRFPAAIGPDTRDICYATQNRQVAVRDLAARVDALIVVGATNSSNSNRLREIGAAAGVPSFLIEWPTEVDPSWLLGITTLGLTAGASAPEILVQETLALLGRHRNLSVETLPGVEEMVKFRLPDRLSGSVQPMPARMRQ